MFERLEEFHEKWHSNEASLIAQVFGRPPRHDDDMDLTRPRHSHVQEDLKVLRDLRRISMTSLAVLSPVPNPRGPTAFAVGFVEVADMPWSLFYRRMAYALCSGSADRSGQATAEAVQRGRS